MTRCGRPTRRGTPCQLPLKGNKCLTHDADLSARNAAVRASFAARDPDGYRAHQAKAMTGKVGALHPTWKGDRAKQHSGRHRAQRLYPAAHPCARCGVELAKRKMHRHHKDRNPLNNQPSNVEWLCEGCHVVEHNGRYQWFADALSQESVHVPLAAADLSAL